MIGIALLFLVVWLGLLALWVACGIWAVHGPKGRKQRARPRLVRS